MYRDYVVATTRAPPTSENPEAYVNNVLEEHRIEIAQCGRSLRGFREHGNGQPYPIRETAVVPRLLDQPRGEVEFHFNGDEFDALS
jgi:hypothetical protein